MLVVKTAWILSFILSRDEEDEKDEDRATHCSRQSQMSSFSERKFTRCKRGGPIQTGGGTTLTKTLIRSKTKTLTKKIVFDKILS